MFSSGGRSRGKRGRGLNRRLVRCIFQEHVSRLIRIWGRGARFSGRNILNTGGTT